MAPIGCTEMTESLMSLLGSASAVVVGPSTGIRRCVTRFRRGIVMRAGAITRQEKQMLRPVSDESPALSEGELQERGNELVTLARSAAITATGKSMHPEFVQHGRSLQRADIIRWRVNAREAISAWREAEGYLTELINELDKKSAQFRATHRQKMTTDDGVNYRTEWVPEDASSTGEKR